MKNYSPQEAEIFKDAFIGRNHDLYRSSPEFHTTVDVLSRIAPVFMDLIAVDARNAMVTRKQMEKLINEHTFPVGLFRD